MARKKQEDVEEGAYWMDTYGDMVTLLLTFFVLLFAMSSLDAEKWEFFVKAFSGQITNSSQIVINVLEPGDEEADDMVPPEDGQGNTLGTTERIENPENFDELYLFLKQFVEDKGLEGEVELTKGDGYTFIQFGNNIFFDGDQSTLRGDGIEILEYMCQAFNYPVMREQIREVAVYGHTAQERANVPNNLRFDWTLSSDRAKNAVFYLVEHSDLDASHFSATGYGQNRPIAPHDGTEENRKKNRRVEFCISEEGKKPVSLDEIYEAIKNGENPDELSPETPPTDEPTTSDEKNSETIEKNDETVVISLPKYDIMSIVEKSLDKLDGETE